MKAIQQIILQTEAADKRWNIANHTPHIWTVNDCITLKIDYFLKLNAKPVNQPNYPLLKEREGGGERISSYYTGIPT